MKTLYAIRTFLLVVCLLTVQAGSAFAFSSPDSALASSSEEEPHCSMNMASDRVAEHHVIAEDANANSQHLCCDGDDTASLCCEGDCGCISVSSSLQYLPVDPLAVNNSLNEQLRSFKVYRVLMPHAWLPIRPPINFPV